MKGTSPLTGGSTMTVVKPVVLVVVVIGVTTCCNASSPVPLRSSAVEGFESATIGLTSKAGMLRPNSL